MQWLVNTPGVWVVARLEPLEADVLQDLVLPFHRDVRVAEDDLEVFPQRVVAQGVDDVGFEHVGHSLHKRGARSDHIVIPVSIPKTAVGHRDALLPETFGYLALPGQSLFNLLGCPETTGSLLVHFCLRGDSVDGEVDEFPGTDDLDD
jgi:hypothetical protein